jgi:hypothetical protein
MLKQLFIFLLLFYLAQSVEWKYERNERISWSFACDFKGQDLRNIQSNAEYCGPYCAGISECTHFTWTTWNGGTCWLKKRLRLISYFPYAFGVINTNDRSMICGFKVR